jgi:hypothetical protein
MRLPRPAALAASVAAALLAGPLAPRPAAARVVRVVVDRREDVGAVAGAPAYERLTGRVFFAFDPRTPHDRRIVDLALAPRNARGEVEAWGEFSMLRPRDPARASGVTLLDVVNRGGVTTGVFHLDARRGAAPGDAAAYGDGLLLRRGLTVVALGWQWDILPDAPGLHFHPPVAGSAARPVAGLVRSDITVDAPTRTIPLGHRVGASQALGYPVADLGDTSATLTVRDGPLAPRRPVPRAAWRFAREDSAGAVVADPRHVHLAAGFEAGRIYEVVYRAQDPVVVGTGLAAVRDMMAWLKHDPASLAPTRWGVAYGVSQTGRFLRHFLYEGFNTDAQGRRAFDGVFAHTAGAGRGSFNHRFAQPSRDAQPYSTFSYPTDVFPSPAWRRRTPRPGAAARCARPRRSGTRPGCSTSTAPTSTGGAARRSRTPRPTGAATSASSPPSGATCSRRRSTRGRPRSRRPPPPASPTRRAPCPPTAATRWTSGSPCGRCSSPSWTGCGTGARRRRPRTRPWPPGCSCRPTRSRGRRSRGCGSRACPTSPGASTSARGGRRGWSSASRRRRARPTPCACRAPTR